MTKIVVLSQATEIDGVLRAKGEVVPVPDDFEPELIKRTLKQPTQVAANIAKRKELVKERREERKKIRERPKEPPGKDERPDKDKPARGRKR